MPLDLRAASIISKYHYKEVTMPISPKLINYKFQNKLSSSPRNLLTSALNEIKTMETAPIEEELVQTNPKNQNELHRSESKRKQVKLNQHLVSFTDGVSPKHEEKEKEKG